MICGNTMTWYIEPKIKQLSLCGLYISLRVKTYREIHMYVFYKHMPEKKRYQSMDVGGYKLEES